MQQLHRFADTVAFRLQERYQFKLWIFADILEWFIYFPDFPLLIRTVLSASRQEAFPFSQK
jgi:hypothetical protein